MTRAGLVLAAYSAMALLALLVSSGRGDPDIYRSDESGTLGLLVGPLLGIGLGLSVVLLSRLAVREFAWARRLHTDFKHLLGPLTGREIAILAIASAVGEELLFRGALTPLVGIWGQAAIFALLHLGPGLRFLPWTLSAFVLGLAFEGLHRATGDLGGPIAAHFIINFVNLGYITRVAFPDAEPKGARPIRTLPSARVSSPPRDSVPDR